MSRDYLQERDNETIKKTKALLVELPPYVRQFYDAKKGSKKELTRYAYIQDIKDFLSYLSPIHHVEVKTFPFELLDKLTVQDIDEYRSKLFEDYKSASVKRKLASLSTFYKYLVLAGFVNNNPAAIIDWPKEDKSKAIVYLDNEQTAKLLKGIYNNDKQIYYLNEDGETALSTAKGNNKDKIAPKKREAVKGKPKNKHTDYIVREIDELTKKRRERVRMRNYCIALLFLKTGMRVSELVSIDLDDIDFRNTVINITGKGEKTRPVGFGEPAIEDALKQYINFDRKALLGKNTGENALFISTSGKRISVRNVETMIKEMVMTYLADDEFVKKEDFSPHKLRSTCATRLLKETGGNIKGVSELLGHDSIEITSRRYAAMNLMENAKEMEKKTLL